MRILAAIFVLSLSSCLATSGQLAETQALVMEMQRAAEDPTVTQAELDALAARLEESMAKIPRAAQQDADSARNWFLGLSEGGVEGGAIGLGLTALAWYMRDRRKRLGKDPIQVAEK